MRQDPTEQTRLTALYRDLADPELLALHASRADLSDIALPVLEAEMSARNLQPPAPDPAQPDALSGHPGGALEEDASLAGLWLFHDAFQLRQALAELEAAEIPFEIRDRATNEDGSTNPGPPVQIQVLVPREDKEAAILVLRSKIGLFPTMALEDHPNLRASESESEDDANPVAESTGGEDFIVTLGIFEERVEADAVAVVLSQANLWHRLADAPKEDPADPAAYLIEVKEADLDPALELVAAALNLKETPGT